MFNLFDQHSTIRHDITEAELMSLDEPRREVVFEILTDHEAEVTAQAERDEAQKEFHARVADLQNEESERDAIGRTTFQDARKLAIRARQLSKGIDNPDFEVAPPDQTKIDAANLRVEKARTRRDAAHVKFTNAEQKLREARAAIAKSLAKWINPVSFDDARLAAIEAQRKRPEQKQPVRMSALDAQAAGARSPTPNVGIGRKHVRRAATLVNAGR